ncbi:MAG: lipocalin family protein [Bacteroidota bacterium]
MKKLIPALICLALFAACKKDNQINAASLVGKWNLNKLEVKYYAGTDVILDSVSNSVANEGKYFQFNKDGTGVTNISQKISYSGYLFTLGGAFTYELSNPTLTLKYNSATPVTSIMTIEKADGSELILKSDQTNNYLGGVTEHSVTLRYFSR